jgi:hypothetical protein
MLTIHLTLSIDAHTDDASATQISEHLRDLIWKETYENLQMPVSMATASAEHN